MSAPLSRAFLTRLLPAGVNPLVFDTLPSTNVLLRERAAAGEPEKTLVVASSQTAGRGRLGRSFHSPPGTGVYFSILLRPQPSGDTAALITAAAALAAAEACVALFSVHAEIKWVNDVLVHGKKVAGILAEAYTDDTLYVILGIGANLAAPAGGFPSGLHSAGAMSDSALPDGFARERYVAETVTRFLGYIDKMHTHPFIDAYRSRIRMTGKTVHVTRGSDQFDATVLGIDDQFRLIVRLKNGMIEHLSYGEVSLHDENK